MNQKVGKNFIRHHLVGASLLVSLVSCASHANDLEMLTENTVKDYHQARYAQAFTNAEFVVKSAQERHNNALLVNALNNLAALQSIDSPASAEQTYQRALTLAQSIYGTSSLAVATILNNLGSVYKANGNTDSAYEYYQRALTLREAKMGTDWIEVAESLNNLASIYKLKKEFSMAESAYTRALTIQQKQLGATHAEIANTLNNHATLLHTQGKLDQASPLYRRAIGIMKQVNNTASPDTAKVMFNYAMLLKSQQQWDASEDVLLQAGPVFDSKLGKHDTMSIKTLEQLADICMKTGRNEKANEYFAVIAQRKG